MGNVAVTLTGEMCSPSSMEAINTLRKNMMQEQEVRECRDSMTGTPTAAGEEFNMIASVLSSTPYRMHGMRCRKRARHTSHQNENAAAGES
jgi:hypothetical protein